MSAIEAKAATGIAFRLNGVETVWDGDPMASLADVLRDGLDLTSTKIGCRVGRCGACTVFVDGTAVNGCLLPAHRIEGAAVLTAEGLDALPRAAALRAVLSAENAFQCGYCAPGFVMAILALLEADPDPDEAAIRAGLSGNVCRCTGYGSIVRAVQVAAKRLGDGA